MKIAVNTRLLLRNKLEGIGWVSHDILQRLVRNHPEHQFYFIFDRPYDESFIYADNVTPVVAYPPARHPYLWYLFFELGVPMQLRRIKPDLFLSMDGWIPTHLHDIPTVDIIHDLNFEHHPEFIKPTVLRYYRRFFHRFAQKADRIATVSQYTRNDIHQLYGVPLDKIDLVYPACNENYRPLSQDEQHRVKAEFSQGCDYFLFVGLIHKRKNLANIFKAFDAFKDKENTDAKLVVVGDRKWWQGEIADTYDALRHQSDVIMLGRQPAENLVKLYASARALVYASLFEGFGLPIVEAFYSDTPVITSNVTSMPEVAEDAALLVDPYDVNQIETAMQQLWNDEALRQNLIAKGRIRRDSFNWDKSAENLWKVIEKTWA